MLTFFRKIRKSILGSDSTKKYLFYAIGEIALVVIGILIALQINNLNDNRKEKNLEERLFNQLFEELLRNDDYNKKLIQEGFNPQISFTESIFKEGQNLNIDSFIFEYQDHWPVSNYSLLNFIYGFTEFYDPITNFYQTAVNDGSISIIRDKEFVFGLEHIYGEGKDQLERIYQKETSIN